MSSSIVNFGSINIDHVYCVPYFVRPGETLPSIELKTDVGGKGANQSVAIARAGVKVAHLGRLSISNKWVVDFLASTGVDVEHIKLIDEPSGHAIIQVDAQGENAIILHGGANRSFELSALESILDDHEDAEYLLMHYECNSLEQALELAAHRNIKVVLNPAPMTSNIKNLSFDKLDTLIVNQGEAEALCQAADLDQIIEELSALSPRLRVVITLGAQGAVLPSGEQVTRASAPIGLDVLDTTGAGDTFVGYFLAGIIDGLSDKESLHRACKAASIAVTKPGALASIPKHTELG